MDIHIADPLAAYEAVGTIFGDDISTGPLRRRGRVWRAPAKLMREAEARAQPGEMFTVQLNEPIGALWDVPVDPSSALVAHRVPMHVVNILHAGRLVGRALRMDRDSQRALDAWLRSWEDRA